MTEKLETKEGILAIFEDLHRATMRISILEMEECMTSMEALPAPRTRNDRATQKTLRHDMRQALTAAEQRLIALQVRFSELPELSTKKSEVEHAS